MVIRVNRNHFIKTQALGNEYIVLNPDEIDFPLTQKAIRKLCDVHFGIGSDGILLKVPSEKADFGLKIFNPDGSEAEKSGNGLRIFCKYLHDYRFTDRREFTVETKGGTVTATIVGLIGGKATRISVEMGKANFNSREIPTGFPGKEAIGEKLIIGDRDYEINCVSMGNPHCVILKDRLDADEIRKYGPLIETNAYFPHRINVQFAKVISRHEAEILIWERGAGYTLASGSSSCAVACVLKKRDLTDGSVTVRMPGGELLIEIGGDWNVRMTGEARQIADGTLSGELTGEF